MGLTFSLSVSSSYGGGGDTHIHNTFVSVATAAEFRIAPNTVDERVVHKTTGTAHSGQKRITYNPPLLIQDVPPSRPQGLSTSSVIIISAIVGVLVVLAARPFIPTRPEC
uniref:Uncharacterized protein n=1 Tax=Mycena chlorophos TaxID=658473 RepID=A0ABQ0KZC7_MYCCL|nr:predicted protein [Mycena chlorophos]